MPSQSRPTTPDQRQLTLQFSPLRNRDFLSNHWLEHRLHLEPEWQEQDEPAKKALQDLLSLWRQQKSRVTLYGDEAGLEEKFIQPVFECLGWHIKYQAYLDRREPDYALFLSDDDLHTALRAGRTNSDFWLHAAAVADAKAWHISLDRPTRIGANREYPPEQIEWYLDRSLRDYGILTNGRLWRLVPRVLGPTKPRFQTYLEIDLPSLLDSLQPVGDRLALGPAGREFDEFRKFFLLFSPAGMASLNGRKRLLDRAVEGSSEYSVAVGEELKDRVFEALRLCTEGFIKHAPNHLDPLRDLRLCQEHSLIFLYRLLFILYAEDRGLLPYRINQTYTNNRSLARHRDEVAKRLDQVSAGFKATDYSQNTTDLWGDLKDLFDLVDSGRRSYGVQAYNGGLFDLEADSFLSEKALPDWYLARVLDQLGRAPQPTRPELDLFRVDYRDLAIQQLGSVYEGLLELHPKYAVEKMAVIRSSRDERVVSLKTPVPSGYEMTAITYAADSVYLETDKGERRRTGSYYTPDHIVDHIVQMVLGAQCNAIFQELQADITAKESELLLADAAMQPSIQAEISYLRGAFGDRILKLKILDPAMGSGHFLIRACQYLAEEIATNPYTLDPEAAEMGAEVSTITYWKRRVAESCLHGVDANPMAVELAKLALWLETVAADVPLTFLNHHLRCGNTIVGSRINRLNTLPADRGLLAGEFSREIAAALPSLLKPLADIAAIDSDTVTNVKQKERIFARRFLPVQKRFATVGDLWCAEAMEAGTVPQPRYAEALETLGTPRRFDAIVSAPWALAVDQWLVGKEIVPFHWELAYPHVFLKGQDERSNGFDVILGNPPYDVLSELENRQSIDHLKRFIDLDPTLEPSKVGKNNLYKIFIARCVELLADGGYLSFIVPMPLLGDEQASGIRKMLLAAGQFTEVHAFPQKDIARRRVFFDAKLSTMLFAYQKLGTERRSDGGFISQVHPAQFIEKNAPSLRLNSNSIKLYDPENLTIVSCSQDDWDLMAALPEERISRLGRFTSFFQGEVNQTVATAKGHLTTAAKGQLVIRGANICLYQMREASQGDDIYLDIEAFLKGKRPNSKAFHHHAQRVGLQESSPQGNFRRVIACRIPAGEFCNHTINYMVERHSRIDLSLILFVLNSSFSDWYFRLGSTNAHVSHYQLANLPAPRFGEKEGDTDEAFRRDVKSLLISGDFGDAETKCVGLAKKEGCSPTVEGTIIDIVEFMEEVERKRPPITRAQRSALDTESAECQTILDKVLLILLGLGSKHHQFIIDRLKEML